MIFVIRPDQDVEKELTPSAYDPYFLDNENMSADRIKAGGSSHVSKPTFLDIRLKLLLI
jgi:hypothetical protein